MTQNLVGYLTVFLSMFNPFFFSAGNSIGIWTRAQNFYSCISEEPDDFQSTLVTTTACWLAENRLRYFLAACLSLRKIPGCAVCKLLSWKWGCTNFLCWRQSSLSFPWWIPVITTLSTLMQHLCWLPVVTVVPMMTSSHRNERNRGNPSHSCWLEVIGLLAHVRINMSQPVLALIANKNVGLPDLKLPNLQITLKVWVTRCR